MDWLNDRRRRRNLLLLAFIVVMVNYPLVHAWWLDRQVATEGVETTAVVLSVDRAGTGEEADHWVSFRFSEDVDPEQRPWLALVEEQTWSGLSPDDQLRVRVAPGSPAAHEVEGELHSRTGLWSTLAADAAIALGAWLLWRRGRRSREAVAEAADVDPDPPK